MNKREEMRAMRSAGASYKEISAKFGVTLATAENYTSGCYGRDKKMNITPELVNKVKSLPPGSIYQDIAKKVGLKYSMVAGIIKGKYDHLIETEFFSPEAYLKQTQTI
jgi:hypothetical protein